MCNHTHAKKQRGRERERARGGKAHLCELHSRCSWHSRASIRCAASYNSDPLRCANADHPQATAPKPPPHPLLNGDHGASAFAITKDRREVLQLNRRPPAPSAAASFCSSLFMPFVTRLLFVTTPFLVSAGSWPAALSGCKSACTCRISSVKLWAHWSSLWMDACRICNSLQLISFRPVRRDRRA